MGKIALITLFIICFNVLSHNIVLEKQDKGLRLSDDKYSGLYKGIYFFEDDGSTERTDVEPIILINDTCSYILFCGALKKVISINDNLITFGNNDYPLKICIGEGKIIDDGDYGEVITKTGEHTEGLIKKTSGITDIEMNKINNAIKEEHEFMDFWRKFIEALNSNNAELLAEFVHFPFEDVYGRFYPKIVSKGAFDISNKSEFIKQFGSMFTADVKAFLNNNKPVKLYNVEVYYISVQGFRPFNFEKINGVWLLTKFPYEV